MARRILLVRHGRSAHTGLGEWVDTEGARHFMTAYDAAGIAADSLPPAELMAAASSAHVLAASDLPRAVESAQRLAPGRELAVTPLLREIELELPRWAVPKLPVAVWDTWDYVRWSYRLLRNVDHEHRRRADAVVGWLRERVDGGGTVLAVTHGSFRRLVAASLSARGWRPEAANRSYDNWSSWAFGAE
jgi:broad specificity phosphatase PhoE